MLGVSVKLFEPTAPPTPGDNVVTGEQVPLLELVEALESVDAVPFVRADPTAPDAVDGGSSGAVQLELGAKAKLLVGGLTIEV